ncbi:MAG: hypothetical protein AAGF56_02955 [Pseudomonadota bacterium]
MTRRLFYMTFFAFLLAATVIAMLLGKRAAQASETEVIERIAETYLAEHASPAARTDCHAVPAQSDGLWLVVICAQASGIGAEYFVDTFGRVSHRRELTGGG